MIAFSSPIQAVDRWYENGGILTENTNISLVGSKLHALANDHVASGISQVTPIQQDLFHTLKLEPPTQDALEISV